MNEVVQATRSGRVTSLLAALHHDTVRLFVSRHVVAEVERNLPDYAADRRVDPVAAVARWRTYYMSYLRVVDVPNSWCNDDERVKAVASQHATDAPTARLAAALAQCYGFAEDDDLVRNGFGNPNWLPLTLASANQAVKDLTLGAVHMQAVVALELVKATGRSLYRLPGLAQLGLLAIGGIAVSRWRRDGRGARHLAKVREFTSDVVDTIAPVAGQIIAWDREARETWAAHEVVPPAVLGLAEQIARIIALGPAQGMLAVELAREVHTGGNQKAHLAATRLTLRQSDAFVEVSRGRWQLGHPGSETDSSLSPQLATSWLFQALRAAQSAAARRVID